MSGYNDIKGGEHLGEVRRWIQRSAANGDTVTWSSREPLQFRINLCCEEMERLAQDIRDAVLREFKVKDTDHKYRYVVFQDGPGRFINPCDTYQEMWTALYPARGRVSIKDEQAPEGAAYVFTGNADEARAWLLAQRDKTA